MCDDLETLQPQQTNSKLKNQCFHGCFQRNCSKVYRVTVWQKALLLSLSDWARLIYWHYEYNIITASERVFISYSLTCVKEIRLKLSPPHPSHDSWNRLKRCRETEKPMVLVESSAHSYSSRNQKWVTIREEEPKNSWHPKHPVITSKAWWWFGQSLLPKSIQVHASILPDCITARPMENSEAREAKQHEWRNEWMKEMKQHDHQAKTVDSQQSQWQR